MKINDIWGDLTITYLSAGKKIQTTLQDTCSYMNTELGLSHIGVEDMHMLICTNPEDIRFLGHRGVYFDPCRVFSKSYVSQDTSFP